MDDTTNSDGDRPTGSCHKHPHAMATERCEACRVPICEYCVTPMGAAFYCRDCGRSKKLRKRLIMGGITLAVLGVIGVLGWLASGAVQFVDTNKMAKGQRVSRAPDEIRRALEIAQDPCNEKLIKPWVTEYPEGNCRKVMPRAQFFFDRCGPFLRLRWSTYGCHKQNGDYDLAIADVNRLIRQWPYDKDFRWWRGELYAQKKQWHRALDDYWQAVLLSPTLFRIPFDLEVQARRAHQPCRAVFPMLQHAHFHPEHKLGPSDLKLRYGAMQACPETLGTGSAIGHVDAGREAPYLSVRVNDKATGDFTVDLQTGMTLLSREYADKLGLPRGKPMLAWYGEQLQTGTFVVLKKVAWENATAKNVEALILDGAPFFHDGVLGRTFLLRFKGNFNPHNSQFAVSPLVFSKLEDLESDPPVMDEDD